MEDLRMFEEDIKGSMAHNIMLYEQGIMDKESLVKILQALLEILEKWKDEKIETIGEYEDIHEYIENLVIEKIGIELAGNMHAGRSRNDQVVLDIKMVSRKELLEIADNILKMTDALLELADQHLETSMVLYTHGQPAQIGTFAHYLLAYVEQFFRDYMRLKQCYERVNTNPLGNAAIGGTTLRLSKIRISELLGFDDIQNNSIDATSSRDWAVEIASVLAILMGNLSRMMADLIMWSGKEYGYIQLADEYSNSSSLMPQKKNPSALELIRGKAAEVFGALTELYTMEKGVPTGYYQDLQQTKIPIWRAFDTTKICLKIFRGVLNTLQVNKESMLEQTKGSYIYSIQLVENLLDQLTFREAYQVIAKAISKNIEKGKTLQELKGWEVVAAAKEIFGKDIKVIDSFGEKSCNPKKALEDLRSPGSPHPVESGAAVEKGKELRKRYGKELDFLKIKLQLASDNLENAIETHVSVI
jgi:argininosuccinate lyase